MGRIEGIDGRLTKPSTTFDLHVVRRHNNNDNSNDNDDKK